MRLKPAQRFMKRMRKEKKNEKELSVARIKKHNCTNNSIIIPTPVIEVLENWYVMMLKADYIRWKSQP